MQLFTKNVWKLLGTLGDNFLGSLLTGKGTIGASEGTVRAVQDF